MNKSEGPIGVFVAVFEDEEAADKGLDGLKFYSDKALILDIYDDAKVVRNEDGRIEVRGSHGARHGARKGLAVGAILGVIFPPSIIVAGAAGAAAGAGAGALRKGLVDHGFLHEMGEYLQPGRAAVIAISDAKHLETFVAGVPDALRTFTHTFQSADAAEIQEWIASIPSTQTPD
jgi:uncharacterized membrane protein